LTFGGNRDMMFVLGLIVNPLMQVQWEITQHDGSNTIPASSSWEKYPK
jgi:hypothetical protein